MKNLVSILTNVLAILGILLVIYCAIGKFTGEGTISLGMLTMRTVSGLIAANSLMLIAIFMKLSSK